ncbi:MAG: hypothetical protein NTW26_00515, partial [bacterium]|nr:hypothetical protein [bacterium]
MRFHRTPPCKWWLLACLAPSIALGAAATGTTAVAPDTPPAAEASTGPVTGVPTFAQNAAPSLTATSDETATEGIPRVTLLSCDPDGASFEVTFPEAETYTEPVGDETYTGIRVSGTSTEDLPGSVGLPVFRARLWIPPGAGTT